MTETIISMKVEDAEMLLLIGASLNQQREPSDTAGRDVR